MESDTQSRVLNVACMMQRIQQLFRAGVAALRGHPWVQAWVRSLKDNAIVLYCAQ